MKKTCVATLLSVAIAAVSLLAACNRANSNAPKTRTIAVIPKGVTNFFWQAVKSGADTAGKETGVKIYWKGPAVENDVSSQINVVEDAITSRVDAIAIAPAHRDSLIAVLERAQREGIP
ncbi:MAG TPA: substrate-binding domain-containing protein, partial [Blastocatellia bacterium]|nr:substrate-binding domain-containing protein [Blastocatellia bacterium]